MSNSTRRSREVKGKKRWPARLLALFALIVIGVYALVFFTGSKSAEPKLGIDLQGGTRVTLVPQGEEPTNEQLQDARNILENRVNGIGVSGASVVVDGNTIVIEAAGDDTAEIRNIGQTSQLFFRPVLDPPAADSTKVDDVILDMTNEWVEYGIFTPQEGQAVLTQIAARKEAAEKENEKAAENPQDPNGEGKDAAPPVGGINLGVGAKSEHQDLAWDAISCITTTEHQSQYFVENGNPPADPAAYDAPEVAEKYPMADTIRESLELGAPRPQTPYYNEVSTAIQQRYAPPSGVTESTPAETDDFIQEVLRGERLL